VQERDNMPLPFAFGKSPLQRAAVPVVKLTDSGTEKLQRMEVHGYEFQVLEKIKELATPSCSAEEVANSLHWDEKKVESIMESLYGKGYIQRAN
jgi:hypothetical protein